LTLTHASVIVVLAAAIFAIAGPAATAWACTCVDQTDQERLDGAAVVFIGTPELVSDGDPVVWEFAVESVQKGKVANKELVEIPRHEVEGCDFNFTEGNTYQVFAGEAGDRLTTSICSGTRELTPPREAFFPDDVEPPGQPPAFTDPGPDVPEQQPEEVSKEALPSTPQETDLDEETSDEATMGTSATQPDSSESVWPRVVIPAIAAVVLAATVIMLQRLRRPH
jgi:hypothetical protein